MRWKFPRPMAVALVWFSILAGSLGVCLGVWYGGELLHLSTRLLSHVMAPVFFLAFYLLAKVGGWILFPDAGALDRAVPMPEPTTGQRLWHFGQAAKSWFDAALVALLSIGGAAVVGTLAHRYGFGTWAITALVGLTWITGIFVAVCANTWTSRKLERYRPSSQAETLVKTFD